MAAEYINIARCPQCKGQHRYRLEVERAWIVKAIVSAADREPPRAVRLTRLFTCPKTTEDFEATFTLTDTSWDRIKNVSVGEASGNERA